MATDRRQRLHEFIDGLSNEELEAFALLVDEFSFPDDEVSPRDELAIREGRAAYRDGQTTPWSELRQELTGE